MLKFLKISVSLLILFIFLGVASCGNKNIKSIEPDILPENSTDSNAQNDSTFNNELEVNNLDINNSLIKFKLPNNKEIRLLDQNFISFQKNNIDISPIDNIQIINF